MTPKIIQEPPLLLLWPSEGTITPGNVEHFPYKTACKVTHLNESSYVLNQQRVCM